MSWIDDLAAGHMVRREDGTYVDRRSFGARPGFNDKVETGVRPPSNVSKEYGPEVAGSFFRRGRPFKAAGSGTTWQN